MKSIYIGGEQRYKKSNGTLWKIFLFLFLLLLVAGYVLKLTAPMIVERWINQKGSDESGYTFSIRDVDLSLSKGQVVLKDVKVFNPDTNSELIKSPTLTILLDWQDILARNKNIVVHADIVDLILSKDFSSEIERIKSSKKRQNSHLYIDSMVGNIDKLNIIEQKDHLSRRVLELDNTSLKVKDISLASINKKTEFTISSNIADGGKLSLTGKTKEEGESTPWAIKGALKKVPAGIFNKIAGDKLPFSFNEPVLNAEINAQSDRGEINGQIAPDITRLNLLEERPGVPTQSISRALTEELTFSLPFTLKDELTLQYQDTYKKLKSYRKL